jgi:Domain of unknown function (DUF6456)
MTRKSAARLCHSTVVAFPPVANARRDRGMAPPPRHVLARPACLDRSKLDKASLHILTMLASTPDAIARLDPAAAKVTVIGRKKGVSLALGQMSAQAAEALCQRFWLKREQEAKQITYVLTPLARQALEGGLMSENPETEWHASHDKVQPPINQKESPLLWLSRRKNSQGVAHISPTQLMAGERLRRDYTLAGMTPKMSANWSGLPVAGPMSGLGLYESERMLDARQRVGAALEACGSQYAGLLLDLCCFLKPLQSVERERGWQARSGKYILAKALSALANHYGLAEAAQGRAQARRITVWKA